ncbi:MAG: PilN domain-containing protein [Thermoleophilaceae bacterium]
MKSVNLIPESQRRRRPEGGDGQKSYVFLAVLGAFLMMTLTYVFVANQATSRSNDAAIASAEADELEVRATQIGAFGEFALTKQARIASVQQLAASRFDWERLMRELARVIPSGGWIREVQAATAGAEESATTTTATAPPAGPSATLIGCMPRQSDVAALMLRLQRMHRVEDVTLQQSARAEAGASATLDDCGPLYEFGVTVTFGAAAPVEAPDGRRGVPASLGGGS